MFESRTKQDNRAVTVLWAMLCLFALGLFPHGVLAQSISGLPTMDELSQTGGDSTALRIFKGMFGDTFVASPLTQLGGADGLLGSIFFVFNGALFVVGTGFILYNTVMMVAVSAHKGEVLGERMSSLWIPIRLGAGIFGMAPVFMGFSLAQALMFMIAILGNNLGDMMSRVAIQMNDQFEVVVPAPGLNASQPPTLIGEAVVDSLFSMHVCQLIYGKHISSGLFGGSHSWDEVKGAIESGTDPWLGRWFSKGPATVYYNTDNGSISVRNVKIGCGGVNVKDETELREESSTGFRSPAVNYENINQRTKAIFAERKAILSEIDKEIRHLAIKWATPFNGSGDEQSQNAVIYPHRELQAIAKKAKDREVAAVIKHMDGMTSKDSDNAIAKGAKEKMLAGGWMTLGSWYSTFAESNAAVQSAAIGAKIEAVPLDLRSKKIPEEPMLVFDKLMRQKEDNNEAGCSNAVGACAPAQNSLLWAMEKAIGNTGGTDMINPIIASKNLGDWMLVGLGVTLVADRVERMAQARSEGLKGVPYVGDGLAAGAKILAWVAKKFAINEAYPGIILFADTPIWGTVLSMMFVLGIVLAVYIPLVPFITWFTASISYFASVVEGMIAAQVWAFSHLHTDGEGMGQRTEKGYVYMLNMLLRPALMILGFFFASAILVLLGTFFFQQLGPAIANMQGNTWTGPLIMFGLTCVIMLVILSMIQTVFNMVYEVPDRVIAWFGHGMEAKMAQNMDREIESKTSRAAAWGGAAAMKTLERSNSRPHPSSRRGAGEGQQR